MSKRISFSELSSTDVRKICVIKPSALGDVVQSMPLLGPLHARFPEAEITWVINRELSDLLTGHPDVHGLIPFDRRGGMVTWGRFLKQMRQVRFDLVLDLQGLARTAAMCLATGASMRVGLESAREGAHLSYHETIENTGRMMPAHARYWRVAEELGLEEQTRQFQMSIPEQDIATAAKLIDGLPRPMIAMHPGARWETKRWPVEKFAAIAQTAMQDYGAAVVLLGSPGEAELSSEVENAVKQSSSSAHGRILNLAGQTTLKQLAAILQSADMVISNDSGPMHLAAELGTPVVGIFTCTDPIRSGPPGEQHALVASCVACAGSYQKQCPHPGDAQLACLRELSTQRVEAAMHSVMSQIEHQAQRA